MLLGTLVSIIFVAAIVVFVIQYYKRVFEHQQELRAKELEKERDLLLALMQGREHEQQRIAELGLEPRQFGVIEGVHTRHLGFLVLDDVALGLPVHRQRVTLEPHQGQVPGLATGLL